MFKFSCSARCMHMGVGLKLQLPKFKRVQLRVCEPSRSIAAARTLSSAFVRSAKLRVSDSGSGSDSARRGAKANVQFRVGTSTRASAAESNAVGNATTFAFCVYVHRTQISTGPAAGVGTYDQPYAM